MSVLRGEMDWSSVLLVEGIHRAVIIQQDLHAPDLFNHEGIVKLFIDNHDHNISEQGLRSNQRGIVQHADSQCRELHFFIITRITDATEQSN